MNPKTGLESAKQILPASNVKSLRFHYRVAPEICEMADRILTPQGGSSLKSTSLYDGPKPATITIPRKPLTKEKQLDRLVEKLREQIRVYGDLIKQGDRLGVIVKRKADRDLVFDALESDDSLTGKSKIIRARQKDEDDYDPSFDEDAPICVLTVQGCKGLEFRAVHWLFADDQSYHHDPEHYYTVVTRAKTGLDTTYTEELPEVLGRAYSEGGVAPW